MVEHIHKTVNSEDPDSNLASVQPASSFLGNDLHDKSMTTEAKNNSNNMNTKMYFCRVLHSSTAGKGYVKYSDKVGIHICIK